MTGEDARGHGGSGEAVRGGSGGGGPAIPGASGPPAAELPVVVVGAGPVGLTVALLLARWRVPTVVVETAARRDAVGSKAICFQRDVLSVLDRIGCAEAMIAEGVTWTTGRTYYREHELFAVTFPAPDGGGPPPWINISQARVEGHLLDRIAAEPLVDLRYDHTVVGVDQDTDGAAVTVDTPAGRRRVRGSHVVGADGSRGVVRRALGIGFPGRTFDDRFLICDIRADLPFPNERRFYFDPVWNPGRQVLVHQCPDSVWRIDWQVPAGFDLAGERASGALDARIRAIVGDAAYEVVWATVYRFHERCAETFGIGRVLLAGDAAHLYAPFGARGLNSGIQDADNLAWKIAFIRHGWGGPALPASYDQERRAAALENLRVTSATMRFLVPRDAGQRARRISVLERAVTDPAARPLIDSGKLAEPYWYLDSPLTTPAGPVEDFPVTPGAARPPVPGVLCPDGACVAGGARTRLRRLFGAGLVVLASGRETAAVAARTAAAAVSAPVTTYALDDLGPADGLREALRARPGDLLVVRPDGHLAAVLAGPDPAIVADPAAVAADPATAPATDLTAGLTAGLTAALRRVVGN